jgi:hypothetical protein
MQELTAVERERAVRLLEASRDRVCASVGGLSEAQWTFKPAPDRWSALDNVEHLAVLGGRVKMMLLNIANAPAAAPERPVEEVDELLLASVVDRSVKLKVPEAGAPTGRWSPAVALEQYRAVCDEFAEIARTSTVLRQHAVPHPLFGPMDGYQWVLAAGAHSDRHNQQILEVKVDPRFPEK